MGPPGLWLEPQGQGGQPKQGEGQGVAADSAADHGRGAMLLRDFQQRRLDGAQIPEEDDRGLATLLLKIDRSRSR